MQFAGFGEAETPKTVYQQPEEGLSTLANMRHQVSYKKKALAKPVPRNTQKIIDCIGNGEVFQEKTANQQQQQQIY